MAANPVNWFEIYVGDMARARAFYETVLGVTLERLPVEGMEYWSFPMEDGRYGAGGALAKMDGINPGAGGTLVYFSCEDCAVEESRVVGAGGHMSLVIDTEGNPIGLHSMN